MPRHLLEVLTIGPWSSPILGENKALSFLSLFFFLEFLVFSPCEGIFLVFLSVFPFSFPDISGVR